MAAEDAAAQAINKMILGMIQNYAPVIRTGIWVSAETADADLSIVSVNGVQFRFIPKLGGVTPSNGDTVVMLSSPSTPLFIIGVLLGDITLAEV